MDDQASLPSDRELLERARNASLRAYAPYSSFRVGAAVVAADGSVFEGSNVENASYGLAMCAERVAIFSAIAAGNNKIRTLVVFAEGQDGELAVTPCGACRQVMAEFMDGDANVVLTNGERISLRDLLPRAFRLSRRTGTIPG